MQDICLPYFVTLDVAGPNWEQTLLNPPHECPTATVCFCEPKRAALSVKPFPYNHSVSGVSAGLNNIRQIDRVKVQAKTSIFIKNLPGVPLKCQFCGDSQDLKSPGCSSIACLALNLETKWQTLQACFVYRAGPSILIEIYSLQRG